MNRTRAFVLALMTTGLVALAPSAQAESLLPIPIDVTATLGVTGCVSNDTADCGNAGIGGNGTSLDPSAYASLSATARLMDMLGVGLDLHLGGLTVDDGGIFESTRGLTFHLFLTARGYFELVEDITLIAGFGVGYGHWFAELSAANGVSVNIKTDMFALKGSIGARYRVLEMLSLGFMLDVMGHPLGNAVATAEGVAGSISSPSEAIQPYFVTIQGGITATLHL